MAALKNAGIGLPEPDLRILIPRHPDKWQPAFGTNNSNNTDSNSAEASNFRDNTL